MKTLCRKETRVALAHSHWHRLSLAETVASGHVSAACYRGSKNIHVLPIVIAEFKFSDVQRQILLADLMECADDAALDDRPEAFNRVGVDCTNDVFAFRMLDDLVRVQLLDVVIANPFIGHEKADLARHGIHHEFGEHFAADRINGARHDVALAADSANHRGFARAKAATSGTATALPTVLVLGLSADERFIHFDDPTKLVEIFLDQRRADAMAHIPSRFVGAETEMAMDLPRAHALLAGQHEVNDLKPAAQIDIGILKDCPGNVGEAITAGAAIRTLPSEFHGLEFVRAVRATARA